MLEAIQGVAGIGGAAGALPGIAPAPGGAPAETPGGLDFGAMLSGLQSAERQGAGAISDLAVAAERDVHDVVLATEMESIAFELAVSVRNRLVDAYQEIFRMSV